MEQQPRPALWLTVLGAGGCLLLFTPVAALVTFVLFGAARIAERDRDWLWCGVFYASGGAVALIALAVVSYIIVDVVRELRR